MASMELSLALVVDARAELAEGPVWDDRRQCLWWIDLLGGVIHQTDHATGEDRTIPVGQPIGALGLRESGDLILAVQDGFATLDVMTGKLEVVAPIALNDSSIRMNDGKVGPDGGFWAGSMATDEGPGLGRLHRLDPSGEVTVVLTNLTIPNGLDWTADGRGLLFVDTPTRRVDRFDVGPSGRTIDRRRPVVEIVEGAGWPDGMTLDAQGYIWVCLWDGWAIERYTPDGQLDRRVRLPAAQVTSCAFGGPELDELYVTTGQEGFPAGGWPEQPHAGGLFRLRPGVRGHPSWRYPG
jgi:sugar lactone lactonase YvrE